jgi:hypothetical protein
MASIALLHEGKPVSFLSEINESKERSDEYIQQNKLNPEDMSKEHVEAEEDHISARKTNNLRNKSGIGDENVMYDDEKVPIQRNNPQLNTHRTERPNSNSTRDSGISGSSNESVSQIPSPVEEEMEIKEDNVTNGTYEST